MTPRPAPGTLPVEEVIVDVWNVGQALRRTGLAWQLRKARRADVIGLLEAARFARLLRRVLGRWWIVYRAHHPGADHSSDVLVLVHRKRVPQPRIRTIGHTVPWEGPKAGVPHVGRSWPVLEWADLVTAIVHRTPGGPQGGTSPKVNGANRPAWVADRDLLEVLVDEAADDDKPVALLGDQNARRGELDDDARIIGLRVIYTATAVDHGLTTPGIVDEVRVAGKDGSDHHRVRWHLAPWRHRRAGR